MLLDHFIDGLLCLQNRFPGLIWRLWEEEGVCIEFFLEELALDCAAAVGQGGAHAVHPHPTARALRIPAGEIRQKGPAILLLLTAFLEDPAAQSFTSSSTQ